MSPEAQEVKYRHRMMKQEADKRLIGAPAKGKSARYDSFHAENLMPHRLRAVAFDLDHASLVTLREALPGWKIEVVNGATAASVSQDWNPGAADLLVVMAGEDMAETLGLCRFLGFCGTYSTDSRDRAAVSLGLRGTGEKKALRADAPLLVLVPPGHHALVRALLEAGADSCLVVPVHAKEVTRMLAGVRQGNRPGRHTLHLDPAQFEDSWRDNGGEG